MLCVEAFLSISLLPFVRSAKALVLVLLGSERFHHSLTRHDSRRPPWALLSESCDLNRLFVLLLAQWVDGVLYSAYLLLTTHTRSSC